MATNKDVPIPPDAVDGITVFYFLGIPVTNQCSPYKKKRSNIGEETYCVFHMF